MAIESKVVNNAENPYLLGGFVSQKDRCRGGLPDVAGTGSGSWEGKGLVVLDVSSVSYYKPAMGVKMIPNL